MPLLEGVGKPILAGNCQDQNYKRTFVSRLWHLIGASLFLPLDGLSPGLEAYSHRQLIEREIVKQRVGWEIDGYLRRYLGY